MDLLDSELVADRMSTNDRCLKQTADGGYMKICLTGRVTLATACLAVIFSMMMMVAGCGGSEPLLPSRYGVRLNVVNQYFDSIATQDSAEKDSTAQGNPNATRAVFFSDSANTQKVTVTVDRYATTSDAASAYNTALNKSEHVPGFTLVSIPAIGQQSFAGTVTQDTETHVGLGALDAVFVFGVTLAGFDATPGNVSNLVGLASAQKAVIDAASRQ
jgi:hypothetical protein